MVEFSWFVTFSYRPHDEAIIADKKKSISFDSLLSSFTLALGSVETANKLLGAMLGNSTDSVKSKVPIESTSFEARLNHLLGPIVVPESRERIALLMGLYLSANTIIPALSAIKAGNRQEAWFQLRYNKLAFSNSKTTANYTSRQFYTSDIFGLYDPGPVTLVEAESVFSMRTQNSLQIQQFDAKYQSITGNSIDNVAANINKGNNGFGIFDRNFQVVSGLTTELVPAENALFSALNTQLSSLGNVSGYLSSTYISPLDVYVADSVDKSVSVIADSLTSNGAPSVVVGTATGDGMTAGTGNDLLISIAGGDTLIGGSGSDTFVGGFGSDTINEAKKKETRGRERKARRSRSRMARNSESDLRSGVSTPQRGCKT